MAAHTIKELTFSGLSQDNQALMVNQLQGMNIACVLLYRGDICAREINTTLSALKTSGKMTFVEWCPTGFKVHFIQL